MRPPAVSALPIIGSFLNLPGKNPKDFLLAQHQLHGPIFRIRAFHLNYVIMAGPSANKFISGEGRDYFQSKSYWQGMMHELDAENFLIGLDGKDHLMLRKMFKGNFDKTQIDPHRETIDNLCIDIFSDIEINEKVEVVERVLQLTSQMIGCIMTGKVPTRSELQSFLYYINTITNHFNLYRLPGWMLKARPGKFRRAKSKTFSFAEGVVDEHLTKQNALQNFVDAVLEASKQCPHLFSTGDIRFSAMLPFFAGIDTMGQTLNYALFELHKHPEILRQARDEVSHFFSEGIPDTAELKKMETLNNVVKETLRLHPSAFGIVRTATCDFEFENHSVKKGEDVVILTTAAHFMDQYFKEPELFDITRYSEPRNEHRHPDVYAPFGRGPHFCLGAGMAESLMTLALGSILHHHQFEILNPNTKFRERINPTPSLGNKFKLRLLDRIPLK